MATQINININGFGTHLNGDRRVSGYSERVIDTEPVTRWQDEFYTLKPGFSPVGYLHAERKLKKKKKKNCSNGQVCGFSCISKTKTCTANMTTAQLKAHNEAKRAERKLAKGGGAGVNLQSGANKSNALDEKYTKIIQDISDTYEKYSMESDPQKKEEFYREYSKLKEEKNSIVKQLKGAVVTEKKQQSAKENEEKRLSEQVKFTKKIAPTIERGESITKKYLEGVDPQKTPIKAMKQMRARMIAQSKVSKEEAEELSKKIILTSDGTKKGEQLRGMASEFYQLTNGAGLQTLRKIDHRLDFDDYGTRASANKLLGEITIATYAKSPAQIKPTLFHELGHHVEFSDPKKQDLAESFVKSRAESPPVKLSQLTGVNYGDDEIAFPNKFVDPYVGKDYKGAGTEVISVGIEHFASPKSMANLYNKDREHFYLLMGMIGDV